MSATSSGSSIARTKTKSLLVQEVRITTIIQCSIANIIAFRSCASKTLRLMNNEEDDTEVVISKASKCVLQDLMNIDIDKEHYDISMNKDIIRQSVSEYLLMLSAKVSPKLSAQKNLVGRKMTTINLSGQLLYQTTQSLPQTTFWR